MRFQPLVAVLLACSLLVGCQDFAAVDEFEETIILWDHWGVPHIYAETDEELMHAFGWAQMHSHGNLLLRLYGQARGESAKLWGDQPLDLPMYAAGSYAESDRLLRTLGVPDRAKTWLDEQSDQQRDLLEAFVDGVNAYARVHPDHIDDTIQRVLPIESVDVLAHIQRAVHVTFMGAQALGTATRWQQAGSNAYAIGPDKSASGNSLLFANPHLPWQDLFRFYEAQLNTPRLTIHGAALVGVPSILIGSNRHLGWTHTVNPHDGMDLYELSLSNNGNSYRWEGTDQELESRMDTLHIRQDDGSIESELFAIRSSRHGPIIQQEDDRALALRVAGWEESGLLAQFWQMMHASSHNEFEDALARLQLPMFNVIYADRDGTIQYVFNGIVPERPHGSWEDWKHPVRGDTSSTLWNGTLTYGDLPKVTNPSSGWVHNANDGPWTATYPMSYSEDDFPPYLSRPGMSPPGSVMRAQRSIRFLQGDERISFDDLRAIKFNTESELAHRVLDDLMAAARTHGDEDAQRAADVLESWDRSFDQESRGAPLFHQWFFQNGINLFEETWHADEPVATPRGLRAPQEAAEALGAAARQLDETAGSLDIAWGEVFYFEDVHGSYPARGGSDPFGIFSSVWYTPQEDGRQQATGGDSFIMLTEFDDEPRAEVLLTYGNATQEVARSDESQLSMYASQELRPVKMYRNEIEAKSTRRDTLHIE